MASRLLDFLKASARKLFRLTGLTVAVFAWIAVLLSVHYNPWFVFTKHAFSDLGGPGAENPWIFNYGPIITGVLALLHSFALIKGATNKVESVGGAFMFIAGIFLALIGVYPSGTTPHNFVSVWFFVQTDLAITTWGIGLLLRGRKAFGLVSIAMGILGPLVALAIKWPSTAILEAYGIAIIDAWVVLMLKVHKKETFEAKFCYSLDTVLHFADAPKGMNKVLCILRYYLFKDKFL